MDVYPYRGWPPYSFFCRMTLYTGPVRKVFREARHLLAVEHLSVLVVLINRLIPGQRDCCFMLVWSFHWLVFIVLVFISLLGASMLFF